MTTAEKLAILADAAKYDASCASSGSRRQGARIGPTSTAGICHSWSADGRCVSLLKILFSNVCRYDCAYCVNRRGNDRPRATFTVAEVVALTLDLYRRNCIEGLFLSSAVFAEPDRVMEQMIATARRLRREEGCGGYIHLKAIPGASLELMRQAGLHADRVSVNIELPSEASLTRLAPQKNRADILRPMNYLAESIRDHRVERRASKRAPAFAPGGQSTQLIVGASPETDFQIVRLGESLYRTYQLKRIYYSAFIPVNPQDSRLPGIATPPLLREHRLYQADWLLRLYGFRADELLSQDRPEWLLRVPGIGQLSA